MVTLFLIHAASVTISMRPPEFTNEPMDARVNEGTKNMTGAGVMIGTLLEMDVVNPIAVVGGAAMCYEPKMKRCLGLLRLTTPPGKGTEKLSGSAGTW